jgi:hypothetical protein
MDHMSKEPFELAWWPLALLALSAANSAGGDGERGLLAPPPLVDAAILALAAGGYLHYVLSVISETCAYLGIRCLAITPQKTEKAGGTGGARGARGAAAAATNGGSGGSARPSRAKAADAGTGATRARARSRSGRRK